MRLDAVLVLCMAWVTEGQEKRGKMIEVASSTGSWTTWLADNSIAPVLGPSHELRRAALFNRRSLGVDPHRPSPPPINGTLSDQMRTEEMKFDRLNSGGFMNEQRRLVEDILDPHYYEKNVHPRKDHTIPTRINLSMSLYQILDVDEHSQSISVNVWMVQDWFDEFLDWDPRDFGMLNKTIVPIDQIWIPDTYLYNSETLEQKKTESLMNAIVSTGHWANDSQGARVQLMFPAIYRLSCPMNVKFFPYDVQNCSFIISSWTNSMKTLDYWPKSDRVNLGNMVNNEEWSVISFHFERVEKFYACCPHPWVMLYAHLVIKRKPLYYVVNLVIPTSIITIVAVTGFFTPTSSSCERDEKLYLGINTLLTMSIMMLMVCNQMPSTSNYVPLMSWYYMGIICVIVLGTLMATAVLAIHGQKHFHRPLSKRVRGMVHNRLVNRWILEVPSSLLDLWTEFGVVEETRMSTAKMDPMLIDKLHPVTKMPPRPAQFFCSISSNMSSSMSSINYEKRLANITRQYTQHVRMKDREARVQRRGGNAVGGGGSRAREIKRQKMARRCNLEWEYLANVLDRILLTLFCSVTFIFFVVLIAFDRFFAVHHFG